MGIVFDQALNTTDSPSFVDGNFSDTVTSNNFSGDGTGNVFIKQPSVGNPIWISHGGAVSYAFYNTTLRPIAGESIELGLDTHRWEKVWSAKGSFSNTLISEVGGSYKLYNLGTEGDTDTEYLELSWATNKAYLIATETGTGIARDLVIDSGSSVRVAYNGNERIIFSNTEVRPVIDDYTSFGTATRRYSDVFSVDGDFSGTVTANTLTSTGGNLTLQKDSSDSIIIGGTFIQCYQEVRPSLTNTYSSGTASLRWSNTYSVDGSFSGNLINEVGGSYNLYNLGAEGDADTEFGTTEFSSNVLRFGTKTTGSGVARDVGLIRNGSYKLYIGSSEATIYQQLVPFADASYSLGKVGKTWSNVYSVDGDFSGTLSAVTVAGQTDNLTLQSNSGASLISLAESGTISLTAFSSIYQQFTVDGVGYRENCYPIFATLDMGSAAAPWDNGYFNNLSSAVGGSYKLYNLGADGDTDTEFLDLSANSNRFEICPKATGAGVVREVLLGSSTDTVTTKWHGTLAPYDSGSIISMGGAMVEFAARIGLRHVASAETDSGGCLETTQRFSSGTPKQTWNEDGAVSFYGVLVTDPCDVRFNITNDAAGNTNYERVRLNYSGTQAQLLSEAGGTGTQREFVIGASGGYQVVMGTAAQGSGLSYNGDKKFYWTTQSFSPFGDNVYKLGGSRTVDRFSGIFSVNGSFGGTIFSEVGGSAKFYNLGVDGDADTEYGSIAWDSNIFDISTEVTGTGTPRSLRVSAGLSRVDIASGGNVTVVRNNATYMIYGSANITCYRYLRPNADLSLQFGAVDRRWAWGSFGGLTTHTQTITAASDTLGTSDHTVLCDCTLNSITINLPAAIDGQQYVIKKIDSSINTVTIDGDSSETIDGALTKILTTQYECVTIVSDGTNWFIVD